MLDLGQNAGAETDDDSATSFGPRWMVGFMLGFGRLFLRFGRLGLADSGGRSRQWLDFISRASFRVLPRQQEQVVVGVVTMMTQKSSEGVDRAQLFPGGFIGITERSPRFLGRFWG